MMARASSRVNQRASSSSTWSTESVRLKRLREAADHQRGGKRPGLGRKVAHLAAGDARLLLDFAPNRRFDGLARLEKTGQRRIHALREAGLAAEKARVRLDREHDDDRIGTRENAGSRTPCTRAASPPRRRRFWRRNSNRSRGARASPSAPWRSPACWPHRAGPGRRARSSADRRASDPRVRGRRGRAGRKSRRWRRPAPRPPRRRGGPRRPALHWPRGRAAPRPAPRQAPRSRASAAALPVPRRA